MDGSGGIRKAIDEFLDSHQDWKFVHESVDNNGLIVIQRTQKRKSKVNHAGVK
jgi:hypothetical protein